MIDAFKIGASLQLQSDIPEALLKFAREFEKLDKIIQRSTENIGKFKGSIGTTAVAVDDFAQALGRVTSHERGITAVGKSFGNMTRAGKGLEKLIGEMNRLSGGTERLADLGKLGGSLDRLGSGSDGIKTIASALERMAKAKLGIAAVALDDYSQALGRVAAHERALKSVADSVATLGRAKAAVGAVALAGGSPAVEAELEARKRDRIIREHESSYRHTRHMDHDFGAAGVGLGGGGTAGLGFLSRSVESGMDVLHERAVMLADDRVSEKQADQAINSAYEATKTAPGTKWSVNTKAILDLKNITGDLGDAEKALPAFANYTAVLQAVDRKKGGDGNAAFAGAKAMDILGEMISEDVDPVTGKINRNINAAQLNQKLGKLAKIASATVGRVDTEDYLRFSKTGAIPGMMFNDEMKYELLPAMLLSMGASRVGTAFQSMSQVIHGNRITDKTYDEMVAAGLASTDSVKITKDAKGKSKRVRQHDQYFDLEDLTHNPVLWSEKAQEQLRLHGFDTTEKQLNELQRLGQRSTYARLLAEMLKDDVAIRNEQKNIQHQRPDLLQHYMKEDPSYQLTQFDAAWEKFQATLGSDIMKPAVAILEATTAALNKLADWAHDNPTIGRVVGEVAGSLFTLASAIGVLSMGLMIYMPAFRAAKALLGAGKGAEAAEAVGARSVMRLAPAIGLGLASTTAGVMLGAGAAAGAMDVPMVDDYGRPIGNWGGGHSGPVAPTATVPPQPQTGTRDNPSYMYMLNSRDLITSVPSGMASQMNRPADGPSGANLRLAPAGAWNSSGGLAP